MLKPYDLSDRICAHSSNAAHAMEVPVGARLLFSNGQVGARPDGTVPSTADEQLQVIFDRLEAILAAAQMTFEDVVKFTVYVTEKSVLTSYFAHRERVMGTHNPPATLVIVDRFPRDGVQVEIEAVAAKADHA